MPLNANGLGTRRGTGSDGRTYIIEHYLGTDGLIYYRTRDSEELLYHRERDEYEVIDSMDTIIRPVPQS